MSINLSVPESSEHTELKPRITVVGVGGAGGNAVNNMIQRDLAGVDFVVANTDAQALMQSRADRRIQLGAMLTEGLGASHSLDGGFTHLFIVISTTSLCKLSYFFIGHRGHNWFPQIFNVTVLRLNVRKGLRNPI